MSISNTRFWFVFLFLFPNFTIKYWSEHFFAGCQYRGLRQNPCLKIRLNLANIPLLSVFSEDDFKGTPIFSADLKTFPCWGTPLRNDFVDLYPFPLPSECHGALCVFKFGMTFDTTGSVQRMISLLSPALIA